MAVAFPTFEELLKKVKNPDLPDLNPPKPTEFDADGASQFGYKLPSGWKLQRQDGQGNTLLSPRGFKVRDFKVGPDGRINDFKMFDANDNPVEISQPDFVAEEQAGLTALGQMQAPTRVIPESKFQTLPFKGGKPPTATFPAIPRQQFTPTGIEEFRKGVAPTGQQEQFKMPTPEEVSTPSPLAKGILEFIKGNVKGIREKGFWKALEESVPQNAYEYIRFIAGPETDDPLLQAGRLFGAGIGELGSVKPGAAGKGAGKTPKGKPLPGQAPLEQAGKEIPKAPQEWVEFLNASPDEGQTWVNIRQWASAQEDLIKTGQSKPLPKGTRIIDAYYDEVIKPKPNAPSEIKFDVKRAKELLDAEDRVPGRYIGGRDAKGTYVTTERGENVPELANLANEGIIDFTTVSTVQGTDRIKQGTLITGKNARDIKGNFAKTIGEIDIEQSRLATETLSPKTAGEGVQEIPPEIKVTQRDVQELQKIAQEINQPAETPTVYGGKLYRGIRGEGQRLSDGGYFGIGEYYSTSPEIAKIYGKKIITSQSDLKNPLFIDASYEKRNDVLDAFWEKYGNVVEPKDLKDQQQIAYNITKRLKAEGYDGVVVKYDGLHTEVVKFPDEMPSTENFNMNHVKAPAPELVPPSTVAQGESAITPPLLKGDAPQPGAGVLYHGTDINSATNIKQHGVKPGTPYFTNPYSGRKIGNEIGFSLTSSEDVAKAYSSKEGEILSFIIAPEAKIATVKDFPDLFTIIDGEKVYNASDAIKAAKAKGFDGVDLHSFEILTSNPNNNQEIQIWNTKILKSSQPGAGSTPPVKPPTTTVTPPVGTGTTVQPTGGQPPPPKSPLGTIEGMWAKGREPLKGNAPDTYLKAQEYGNDIFYGIRRMQGRVAKNQPIVQGGKNDVVTLLTRAPGAANAGATRYILAIDEIKKVAPKALADDINTILYANHAKEVLAEKGTNRVMAGGFRDATDLDDALAQLQLKLGPDEFKQTEQAAQIVKNLYASERQRLVDSGLIAQELADELAHKYPWYNPLKYVDDAEELAGQGKSVKPFNVISSGLKRLTEEGTAKESLAPLNLLGDQLIRNEVRIVKNDTAKAIIKLALQDKQLTKKLKGVRPVATVEGETIFRRTTEDIPGTLSFFENGKRQIYEVPDFIYREANVLTKTISNPVSSLVGALNGVSRAAFTSASPPFVVSNMLNDMLTAFINRGIMPQETGLRLIQSLRGLENDKVMQAFRLAGGFQQRFFGRSANALAKDVGVTGGGIIKNSPSFLKKVWRSIPAAGEVGEQAPRTALFNRQLDKTLPNWRNMTVEEIAVTSEARKAAADAVELTINFGRGGYAIKAANPFVIFLNASMEGTKLPFRSLRDNPAARWRLAGIGAGVTGLAGYNLSYPEYMDIPNYIRWGSVVVMLPSKEKNPDGTNKPNYATIIPRTREWGAFLGPLIYGMERVYADAPAEFGKFSATMAPMLSPIAEVPIPELIGELVEQQANWDFYRSQPIVSQSLQNLPTAEQTTPSVSRTVEIGAQAAGVSPVRAQHAVSGIFGGAAQVFTSVTDYIADLLKPETPRPEIVALSDRYQSLSTDEQKDFLKRMSVSNKRAMLNYINDRPANIPLLSSIGKRVMPGRGGQLEQNKFEAEKGMDVMPGYWQVQMTPEQKKTWTEKKSADAKIKEKYNLDMMNKSAAIREKYLEDNPDIEAIFLLWGDRKTINSLKSAEKLESEAKKYGIPLDVIPAFSKTEDGKERIPSNRKLWPAYFEYNDLPGTSYLNMTKDEVEASRLPEKYRKDWELYQKLKTETAKKLFRDSHKEAAKSNWREESRSKDLKLNEWLIENKGLKPLKEKVQTVPKTAQPKLRRR